jgi:hypothetical protein
MLSPDDSVKIVVSPVRVPVSPLQGVRANQALPVLDPQTRLSGHAPQVRAKSPNEVPDADSHTPFWSHRRNEVHAAETTAMPGCSAE